MKIVVFGANGRTGGLVTAQALAEGHAVTAVTRHPEAFPLRHDRLRVMRGDVFDPAAVDHAVAGQEAVLSALGVPYGRTPITLYSQGIAHIMQAMRHTGVRRLVCVSSSSTDPRTRDHDTGGGFIYEKVIKPLVIATIGRTQYADLWRMETLVMHSDLDWTIVRPSGLFETPAVTDYRVAEASIRGLFTSRADLADCLLRQLTADEYLHKAVAVATFSAQPTLFAFLAAELFQRQPRSNAGPTTKTA